MKNLFIKYFTPETLKKIFAGLFALYAFFWIRIDSLEDEYATNLEDVNEFIIKENSILSRIYLKANNERISHQNCESCKDSIASAYYMLITKKPVFTSKVYDSIKSVLVNQKYHLNDCIDKIYKFESANDSILKVDMDYVKYYRQLNNLADNGLLLLKDHKNNYDQEMWIDRYSDSLVNITKHLSFKLEQINGQRQTDSLRNIKIDNEYKAKITKTELVNDKIWLFKLYRLLIISTIVILVIMTINYSKNTENVES